MKTVSLPSGQAMPMLGLGTYEQLPQGAGVRKPASDAIVLALKLGYRHIDTAAYYKNYADIAAGIRASGVPRRELFVTTKVYSNHLGHDDVLSECRRALEEMDTPYVDLYLMHWPNPKVPMKETFEAFGGLLEEGLVRDVGVCNLGVEQLTEAMAATDVPVAVHQFEFSPFNKDMERVAFCRDNGITVTAYSPIAQGRVSDDPDIRRIAETHRKSPVQVTLRWMIQRGIVAIPKATSEAHLAANMDAFEWDLDEEEMRTIDNIETRWSIFD